MRGKLSQKIFHFKACIQIHVCFFPFCLQPFFLSSLGQCVARLHVFAPLSLKKKNKFYQQQKSLLVFYFYLKKRYELPNLAEHFSFY